MKIAVIADLHSNLPALEVAVEHISNWNPDHVIVAGDTINRGPNPAECLGLYHQMEVEQGWRIIRGNHEDYVLKHDKPGAPRSGPEFELHQASYWTLKKLANEIPFLREMQETITLPGPSDSEIRIVHASMTGNRDGIYPETSDHSLRKKIQPAPDVIIVGHTHRPLIRHIDNTMVINVGSGGLPFDNDPRLAYGQITWNHDWHSEIIRLEYDIDQAERNFHDTGYLDQAGPLTKLVLEELKNSSSRLFSFVYRYQESILSGSLSMESAVSKFLQS